VHLRNVGLIIKSANRVQRISIDAGSERPPRAERIRRMPRRDVDGDLLGKTRQSEHYQHNAHIESFHYSHKLDQQRFAGLLFHG